MHDIYHCVDVRPENPTNLSAHYLLTVPTPPVIILKVNQLSLINSVIVTTLLFTFVREAAIKCFFYWPTTIEED